MTLDGSSWPLVALILVADLAPFRAYQEQHLAQQEKVYAVGLTCHSPVRFIGSDTHQGRRYQSP